MIPAKGTKFSPYAILRFMDISDARYFKYIFHKRKTTDSSMSYIRTVRWSISSSDLNAGKDKDFIQAVQDQIVVYYNTQITNKLSDSIKILKDYHAKMIKINPVKVPYKGDQHIVL